MAIYDDMTNKTFKRSLHIMFYLIQLAVEISYLIDRANLTLYCLNSFVFS